MDSIKVNILLKITNFLVTHYRKWKSKRNLATGKTISYSDYELLVEDDIENVRQQEYRKFERLIPFIEKNAVERNRKKEHDERKNKLKKQKKDQLRKKAGNIVKAIVLGLVKVIKRLVEAIYDFGLYLVFLLDKTCEWLSTKTSHPYEVVAIRCLSVLLAILGSIVISFPIIETYEVGWALNQSPIYKTWYWFAMYFIFVFLLGYFAPRIYDSYTRVSSSIKRDLDKIKKT